MEVIYLVAVKTSFASEIQKKFHQLLITGGRFSIGITQNKYAIHAYTHGPVTGSGSSVVEPLSVTVV